MIDDDELDVNFTIKATLEETGLFQVETFNDKKLALSIFRPGLYDLALLDIRMPEMNGFQLCTKLREIDNRLKICFLTTTKVLYFRETDSEVINDLGTDCFVSKPVNTSELVLRLKTILSRNS
jgi:DNA-binding response OmpR family regulator